jgi:hypothetical protein
VAYSALKQEFEKRGDHSESAPAAGLSGNPPNRRGLCRTSSC